jgi:hypothetical protein
MGGRLRQLITLLDRSIEEKSVVLRFPAAKDR